VAAASPKRRQIITCQGTLIFQLFELEINHVQCVIMLSSHINTTCSKHKHMN
jgi:hypothetical protein